MKCDQYLSGHLRVTKIVMGHLIYWYGRVGTGDWDEGRDGDCVISIPDVQIGPSRAQLIPIHFPSCNLSPITMLLQTSLHTTRRSHCSTIMQGENSQWTNQFSFSPKIHVMFHADPERYWGLSWGPFIQVVTLEWGAVSVNRYGWTMNELENKIPKRNANNYKGQNEW